MNVALLLSAGSVLLVSFKKKREDITVPQLCLHGFHSGYSRRSSMRDSVHAAITNKMNRTKQNSDQLFRLLRYGLGLMLCVLLGLMLCVPVGPDVMCTEV